MRADVEFAGSSRGLDAARPGRLQPAMDRLDGIA